MQPTGKKKQLFVSALCKVVRNTDAIIRCIQMMPLVTNIEYLLQHERVFVLYFGTYVCVRCLIFCRVWGDIKIDMLSRYL
jgi:hypothetical protein